MSDWISVEDHLPAQYEWVDVYGDNRRWPDCQYDHHFDYWWFYNEEMTQQVQIPSEIKITHWQPRPNPPENKETDHE